MENQIFRRALMETMVLHIIMVHMVMVTFIIQFAYVLYTLVVISVFLLSAINNFFTMFQHSVMNNCCASFRLHELL